MERRMLLAFSAATSIAGIVALVPHGADSATPSSPAKEANTTTLSNAARVANAAATSGCSASTAAPNGVSGNWKLAFDDEFNGSTLDTTKWAAGEGYQMNNVTRHASNVTVGNGKAILTLASSTSGATIETRPDSGANPGYLMPTNAYAEACIYFTGSGGQIPNWGGWWTAGQNWPVDGENDIAETMSGQPNVNYWYYGDCGTSHYCTDAYGPVPGDWTNAYHTYGLYRHATTADVYYDGVKVKTYDTHDSGAGQGLLLTTGYYSKGPTAFGPDSQIKVDYVRSWVQQ